MVPEEIHKPLPKGPSQGRVPGFSLLHGTALNCINQEIHLKIWLHTACRFVAQKDLIDDNRLGHYVLELRKMTVGKPPAQRIVRIRYIEL